MRILIVHPFGIGDCLFMTPLLKAIRKQLDIERLDVVLGSRTKSILENNPNVDEIFVIDKDKWFAQGKIKTWIEKRRLISDLKKHKYDVYIDFSLRKEYAKLFKSLRIPKRIGFDHQARGKYLNFSFSLPKGFQGMHVVEFYCKLADFLGIKVEDKHLDFNIPQDAVNKAEEILNREGIGEIEKIIVISPGGGSSWGCDAYLKQWPVENFIELISRIENDFNFDAVVILGSKEEYNLGEDLKAALQKKVVNLCGKTLIELSAAIIKRAKFFIGNDGGLVHIASSLRVPLIALYGPTDPVVYGPYPPSDLALSIFNQSLQCRPCYLNFHYNDNCQLNKCLQELTPGEVYNQIKQRSFFRKLKDL